MPLYEYECEQCGNLFEVIQKFSDEPLTTHEKCGGKVRRLISAPAFQFKGSGWYVTDYAKGGNSPENGTKKGDSSESKSTSGSDTGSTSSTSSEPASGSKSSGSKSTTSDSK